MATKTKKNGIKKGATAKKPAQKNRPATRKKPAALKADKATRAAAKKRRARIYDCWLRGLNAGRVSEREGIPLSTVQHDYEYFAKEAADQADVGHKRARAEMLFMNTVGDIQADLEEAAPKDARGRAALYTAKLKALESYCKINGLLVDKVEHGGEIRFTDPRLDGLTNDELKALIAGATGSGGKARGGKTS
jgi:hypothetical protein